MSWVTVICAMITFACLMLAMGHLIIRVRQTRRRAHRFFSVTALSAAGIAGCELLPMRPWSAQQFGSVIQWARALFGFGSETRLDYAMPQSIVSAHSSTLSTENADGGGAQFLLGFLASKETGL
jgi:hypothetical protein